MTEVRRRAFRLAPLAQRPEPRSFRLAPEPRSLSEERSDETKRLGQTNDVGVSHARSTRGTEGGG